MVSDRVPLGESDLSELGPYLERAAELGGKVRALRDLVPSASNHFTARFVDTQQVAGVRTYIHAYACLSSAYEHADALWALIDGPHGLTPIAPWTILRTVFEAGFWATWILDSEHSFVRRQRGLRMELVDRSEQRKWINSLPPDTADRAKLGRSRSADKTYKEECRALSLNFDQAGRRPSVVAELPKLTFCQNSDDGNLGAFMVSTWRSLSGMEHGHAYASQLHNDMNEERKMQGGSTFQVSVNDDSFITACEYAYALMIEGADLYVNRSTEARRIVPPARSR